MPSHILMWKNGQLEPFVNWDGSRDGSIQALVQPAVSETEEQFVVYPYHNDSNKFIVMTEDSNNQVRLHMVQFSGKTATVLDTIDATTPYGTTHVVGGMNINDTTFWVSDFGSTDFVVDISGNSFGAPQAAPMQFAASTVANSGTTTFVSIPGEDTFLSILVTGNWLRATHYTYNHVTNAVTTGIDFQLSPIEAGFVDTQIAGNNLAKRTTPRTVVRVSPDKTKVLFQYWYGTAGFPNWLPRQIIYAIDLNAQYEPVAFSELQRVGQSNRMIEFTGDIRFINDTSYLFAYILRNDAPSAADYQYLQTRVWDTGAVKDSLVRSHTGNIASIPHPAGSVLPDAYAHTPNVVPISDRALLYIWGQYEGSSTHINMSVAPLAADQTFDLPTNVTVGTVVTDQRWPPNSFLTNAGHWAFKLNSSNVALFYINTSGELASKVISVDP